MTSSAPSARKAAGSLLDQIIGEGRLLSELVAGGALERLPPEERARAQRLATDTLRGMERVDRQLSRHLRKSPPLSVRNLMRIGTLELCLGGDAHGVVHDMVTIIGTQGRFGKFKGLVNAVLRKIAEDGPRKWHDLRIPRLRQWLRDPLVSAYGQGVVNAMERAHFEGAPLDLTAKTAPEAVARATGGTLLPSGSVRLTQPGQISALPGYTDGDWWVQDAAAAIPVRILNPQPKEHILDLCAAPGGKTMQLAASGAHVTALDISEARMERVTQNLARTGLRAELVIGDALTHAGGPYDAILLDAPCSATGTIRRHPDLPFAKDGSEFSALFEMQSAMLDHAVSLLKPGGRLVYCTCSLLPDEGEVQVEEALSRHEGLATDRDALNQPGLEADWQTEEGGVRLRPDYWRDQGGMDGFYIACLRR